MANKKAKKKSRAASGVDPNEARRARLDARRAAKLEAARKAQRAQMRARLIRRVLLAALIGGALYLFFIRPAAGPGDIEGHDVLSFSTTGSGQHTKDPVQYEMTPPVSGTHAPQPAACGVHGTQIPDEDQVHTLEHGAVGIQFEPTLEPAEIKEIEALVESYDSHVFSAPYAGMDSPITVTSWGHAMELDIFEEDAITAYIDRYMGNDLAPEAGTPCPSTADDPFSPAPSGTISPAPSPAPSPQPRAKTRRAARDGEGQATTSRPKESSKRGN